VNRNQPNNQKLLCERRGRRFGPFRVPTKAQREEMSEDVGVAIVIATLVLLFGFYVKYAADLDRNYLEANDARVEERLR